jgi:hypothetical protein
MMTQKNLLHSFAIGRQNIVRFLFIFMLVFTPACGKAQQVINLFEKLTENVTHKNFYTAVNLCREIIKICEKSPEPECWFTNIMKDVYRYKGLSEFEIYKQELKNNRINDAIESLTLSYNLFKDPEVEFLLGYLTSIKAVSQNDRTDVRGLVTAWHALLNLYARNGWQLSTDISDKIKLYIRISEKFSEPIPSQKYSGAFAKFIIVMACELAEKNKLSENDQKYFEEIRAKYFQEDALQWQRWRSNNLTPK